MNNTWAYDMQNTWNKTLYILSPNIKKTTQTNQPPNPNQTTTQPNPISTNTQHILIQFSL